MALPAIQVAGLTATVDAEELAERRLRLHIRSGVLMLSEFGLARLLPPSLPLQVDRIAPARLLLRVDFRGRIMSVEVRPRLLSTGRIRLELGGLVGLFAPVLIGLFRERLAGKPGLDVGEDNQLELDLAEILRPLGIYLPPPTGLQLADGYLQILFDGPEVPV